MKFISYYDSPLGKITLAGDEAGLCGLWFEGEKYYAHALATSGTDKKQGSADLLAKEQCAASETQRDFAALKKSGKSNIAAEAASSTDEKYNTRDFAAEAESGADAKFCAHTLIASEKFFTRDFAAYDAGKNLAPPIFRRKAGAENSAQTSKADTSRRETWSFSIKLGAGSICILADSGRVLRPL